MKKQFIEDFFRNQGGSIRTSQLRAAGFTHYQLNQLMQSWQVLKVRQGVYTWNESNQSEWVEVTRIVPNGIFCLFSACQQYELTTFVSGQYHLAIPKKTNVTLPLYPPIKLYYWEHNAYQLGKTQRHHNGVELPIYDLEKTVCDVLRQRNKLGMEMVREVLDTYLRRPDRNLARLVEYANQLGLSHYVSTYLALVV